MNKFIAIGRLTKAVELRATTGGTELATFSLAVTRPFKNKEGNYDADFFNCIAFGKLGETIKTFVNKGDLLGIEGRLQVRNYDNSEGKKVYVTEVIVENIDFLQPKNKEEKTEVKAGSYTTEEIDNMPIENDPFEEQLQIEEEVEFPW